MFKRHKAKARTYHDERQHMLEIASTLDPFGPKYREVMNRLDQLDKIIKRSDERVKTIVPACVTAVSLVGIYVVQQFAGIVMPKALDMLPGRSTKEPNEKD